MNELAFSYRVIRSRRKSVTLRITPEGMLEIRCPRHMTDAQLQHLLADKASWIKKHLAAAAAKPVLPPFSPEEIQALTREAKETIPPRAAFFAGQMGLTCGRITVRSQRSRWGSCSSLGNLNFNCLLMLTPPEVRDYVIVHELCHRIHMDHSASFWAEVEKILPDYRSPKKWLKENGNDLISRLPRPRSCV